MWKVPVTKPSPIYSGTMSIYQTGHKGGKFGRKKNLVELLVFQVTLHNLASPVVKTGIFTTDSTL